MATVVNDTFSKNMALELKLTNPTQALEYAAQIKDEDLRITAIRKILKAGGKFDYSDLAKYVQVHDDYFKNQSVKAAMEVNDATMPIALKLAAKIFQKKERYEQIAILIERATTAEDTGLAPSLYKPLDADLQSYIKHKAGPTAGNLLNRN